MNRNILQTIRRWFGPEEGSFVTVLNHQGDVPAWRLDILYDIRVYDKPKWVYQEWKDLGGWASVNIPLEEDEVYGFLKAKFPNKDLRKEIVDFTINGFQNIIEEIKRENP